MMAPANGTIVSALPGWFAVIGRRSEDGRHSEDFHLEPIIAWRIEATVAPGKEEAIYLQHPITSGVHADGAIAAVLMPDGMVDEFEVGTYPCLDAFFSDGVDKPFPWESPDTHPVARAACERWRNQRRLQALGYFSPGYFSP